MRSGGIAAAAGAEGGVLSGRAAAATAIAGLLLMGASGALLLTASGFSWERWTDPRTAVATGAAGADLVRWAGNVDMFGYLLLAPLAFYFRRRFRDDPLIDLYTAAGLAYMLIGAIGAAILASAAPQLIRAYDAASSTEREAIIAIFATVSTVVQRGLWQTLEGIPAAVWALGVARLLYRSGQRRLAIIFVVGALAGLLPAAAHIVGL